MLNLENTSCEFDSVFCDWLDITFSALENEPEDFIDFFLDAGFELAPKLRDDRLYSLGCSVTRSCGSIAKGVVKITRLDRQNIIRVSVSGVCLEFLRHTGWFNEMLGFFSERPYFITRIDAAMDKDILGYKRIENLRSKFPETCALSSRALRTKSFLSLGLHGRSTGTFYVGHRSKANTTARCYDKRHQIWEMSGHDIGFEVFRYEITVKFERGKGAASLRDVSDPTNLFFHYASPSLMRAPKSVSCWEPSNEFSFEVVAKDASLPVDRLKFLVRDNYLFERMAKVSLEEGAGGVDYVLSLVREELVKHAEI